MPGSLEPGPPLPGNRDVDVAIVGAGFTGLWTAYYLAQADPGLRIAICEKEIAGFGASGPATSAEVKPRLRPPAQPGRQRPSSARLQ